jgi:hypothetical protein
MLEVQVATKGKNFGRRVKEIKEKIPGVMCPYAWFSRVRRENHAYGKPKLPEKGLIFAHLDTGTTYASLNPRVCFGYCCEAGREENENTFTEGFNGALFSRSRSMDGQSCPGA